MTTITINRAVVEQALEALQSNKANWPEKTNAITALRAALAQEQAEHDPALSAALGWPSGISDPVLDRKELLQKCAALRVSARQAQPNPAQRVVDEQAEDEGLWFRAQTAAEAYLQQELRRLHAAVEGEK